MKTLDKNVFRMVGDIFDCVGELVEEKTKLVESIADFVSEKVSFYFFSNKAQLKYYFRFE